MTQNDPRIPNLQDTVTPFSRQLCGIYKRSYAHVTIRDRMPVILTKIVDTLCQNKSKIIATYGPDAEEDIKEIIGFISQLKNEIVTNKALKPLRLNTTVINDAEEWNKYLEDRTSIEANIPTWFNTRWLYCETYMYRVLAQEIRLTYDLSATSGSSCSKTGNPLTIVEHLKKNILVNDWEIVWDTVNKKMKENDDIHIVLDNAGYELFTDLCLAAFLVTIAPTTKITFHAKLYPWYVSDTTVRDFQWTLDYMTKLNDHPNIQLLGTMFTNLTDRQVWCIKDEPYWTGPYDFRRIIDKGKNIYAEFADAKLVIFKGDLNYRKLLGDVNYPYDTSFATALKTFQPTNILSLRTMKSDICIGLSTNIAKLFIEDYMKLTAGEYGLIEAAMFKI
ncbi:hypothetical protein PUN28_006175 [Cardiocondyla obscurior]|uniref:Sugar phosphate phosphatase n=1 Tax=Cardiocondyla obscurior TaxID=286306 RepID=A0AAW2G974_9HYME